MREVVYPELFIKRERIPLKTLLCLTYKRLRGKTICDVCSVFNKINNQIYYPILINEAQSGYPLIVQLRQGNSHPGKGILSLLRWLFWRLRKAWSDVKITLRGNPRFLLTNMEGTPQEIYDNFYVKREATSEQRIKELKLGIKAKRLSCQKFIANQFRLFLAQAAYILMLEVRQAAKGTVLEKAQVFRLRETLIKIGAKITVNARKILVELANNCPMMEEIKVISQKLCQGKQLIFS